MNKLHIDDGIEVAIGVKFEYIETVDWDDVLSGGNPWQNWRSGWLCVVAGLLL